MKKKIVNYFINFVTVLLCVYLSIVACCYSAERFDAVALIGIICLLRIFIWLIGFSSRIRYFFFVIISLLIIVPQIFILSGLASNNPGGQSDYILILGGASGDEGPSAVLINRMEEAIHCITPSCKYIIVSGGRSYGCEISEAEHMRDYLMLRGVTLPIVMEPEAEDTFDNLVNSRQFVREGDSGIIVSSWFHIPRVKSLSEYLHMSHVSFIGSSGDPFLNLYYDFREIVAIYYDLFQYGIIERSV